MASGAVFWETKRQWINSAAALPLKPTSGDERSLILGYLIRRFCGLCVFNPALWLRARLCPAPRSLYFGVDDYGGGSHHQRRRCDEQIRSITPRHRVAFALNGKRGFCGDAWCAGEGGNSITWLYSCVSTLPSAPARAQKSAQRKRPTPGGRVMTVAGFSSAFVRPGFIEAGYFRRSFVVAAVIDGVRRAIAASVFANGCQAAQDIAELLRCLPKYDPTPLRCNTGSAGIIVIEVCEHSGVRQSAASKIRVDDLKHRS